VHHRYQRHRWQIYHRYQRLVTKLRPVSTTPAANFSTIFASVVDIASSVNDTCGKFSTGVNDADGKLPPVSTTIAANLPPVANNGDNYLFKINLKKNYLYANSTTQRCPKEILNNFMIEDFSPVANLELRISP
jgi:hypothetical protein